MPDRLPDLLPYQEELVRCHLNDRPSYYAINELRFIEVSIVTGLGVDPAFLGYSSVKAESWLERWR